MIYKLSVEDGMIEYLMRDGTEVVRKKTKEDNAYWMMQNKPLSAECIDGYAEFQVHAGEFYFKGKAVDDRKRRRKKDIVCQI